MGLFGKKRKTSSLDFKMLPPTDLTTALSQGPQLLIKQKRELAEAFLGFETRNRYLVFDVNGAPCGSIVERGHGFTSFIKRVILKSHRPFVIDVVDAGGAAILELSRKFFFFFSDIAVRVPNGPFIGSCHRRFAILSKVYDLRDPNGQTFCQIRSSLFKIWTFAIRDNQGKEIARISKKWSGPLQEMFTDADNFIVEFGTQKWSAQQRATILAAAVAVDFDFFENNND